MANHASALKRVRSDSKKRLLNRYQLKSCRTAIKKFYKTTEIDQASLQLKEIDSRLDKLAKRNILHKNRSASIKSRLAKRVNSMKTIGK